MDNVLLKIHDFKCFKDASFELRNLTILTGANASGKSSIIQTLMFLKQVALYSYVNKNTLPMTLPESGLSFGRVRDVVHFLSRESKDAFSIEINNNKVEVREDETNPELAKFDIANKGRFIEQLLFDRMLFLSAERLGPREESIRKALTKGDIDCGMDGRYTASIMDENFMASADAERSIDIENKRDKFSVLLDTWVDYIFPGVSVRAINLSERKCKIVMRSNISGNIDVSAPNIGFGISYVLPILVEALLIQKEGWLVVENPEVHLHAKAQSNLGYFLGVIAGAGVRVVIETHSEHVVNGVRRAIVEGQRLSPDEVKLYFLSSKDMEVKVDDITIDLDGNLSAFPVDFFDQQRQDSKAIFDCVRKRQV